MSTGLSVSSNSTRFRGLDALRGISALLVVLYHATNESRHLAFYGLLKYPVWLVQFTISHAYITVFLFFVISGFCIHLQWARARAAGQQQPEIHFGAFWKRRIRRLYPTYVIAIAFFLLLTALSTGLNVTRSLVYDVGMHLLMLHNLDPHTCYSISGIFWTLAVEEQLYLAYFLLLFMRVRWGWTKTITVCLLARVGWMVVSHVVWLKTGYGLPVPEAAASHWFTWALGAMAVEAMLGLIKLPRWARDLRVAAILITTASIISSYLPVIPKDTVAHELGWFLIHPFWGLGFFITVNRIVRVEQNWNLRAKLPLLVSMFATIGLFSYSIYLSHELVIMQSWRWANPARSQLANAFLVVLPATIVFSWVFFWFFERPFMVRRATATAPAVRSRSSVFKLIKEGLPSRALLTNVRTNLYARFRRGPDIAEPTTEPASGAVGPATRLANTYADSIAVADGQN